MRTSKPIILHIPDEFVKKLENEILRNKPEFKFDIVNFYYVVNYLVNYRIRFKHKFRDGEEYQNGFVSLPRKYFTKIIGNYSARRSIYHPSHCLWTYLQET